MKEQVYEVSMIATGTERRPSRVKWFFLFTVFSYSTAVAAIIVGGILLTNPQLIELVRSGVSLAPPPPPPAPPAGEKQPTMAKVPTAAVVPVGFVTPTVTPKSLPPTAEGLPGVGASSGVPGGVPGGVAGGVPGGVIGGVLGSTGLVEAPPPAKVEAPPPTKPVRVATGVLRGNAIRRVPPKYPLIAREARVEDTVEVNIVIDEQGNVISAEVVRGHPLFRQEALRAARQWKFRPTLMNGQAVKITGVLTFTFQLT